jgi:pimeloyl-ACP methyl ester carboxylesterase
VPYVERGEARIWYTEQGTGFPMLTLAPGGMRSSVPLWEMAAINPLTAYAGQYRMIAMDQRNAGQSAGPLEAGDPWGAYAADQLAVMDHLGIDQFLAFGCCIGGPFILKLCQLAPERVVAAVLEQPVGITAANRELFDSMWKQWAEQLMSSRGDLGSDQIEAFATTMWARDFAVSVTRDQVRSFRTPMSTTPPRPAARSPPSHRPPSCSSRGRTPSTFPPPPKRPAGSCETTPRARTPASCARAQSAHASR